MLKDKKKKKKERESARILSDDSDDSSRRARRHSNEDLRHSYDNGHVRTGKARTPRDMRTRSRSPSPNGRIRARSLSPPLRKSIFDPYHTNSKEKLVGRRDRAEDENSSRQLPWLKQKGARSNSPPDRFRSQDDDIQVPPRGRGLSPLAPLDSGEFLSYHATYIKILSLTLRSSTYCVMKVLIPGIEIGNSVFSKNSVWFILCFLPEASFGLQVLSLPASVRVCMYQSLACPRENSGPVQARIPKFGSTFTFKVIFNLKM